MGLRSKLRKVAQHYNLSLAKLLEMYKMNTGLVTELIAELEDVKRAHKHDKQAYKSLLDSALKALYNGSQEEAMTILEVGLGKEAP